MSRAPPPNKALLLTWHSDRDAMTTNFLFAKAIRVEDEWAPRNPQQIGRRMGRRGLDAVSGSVDRFLRGHEDNKGDEAYAA